MKYKFGYLPSFGIDSEEATSVAFVSIYDKSEYDTIDLDIVKKMIKEYLGEA